MKTDAELNRLIAERVMGYRFEPHTVMLGKDAITFDGYAPDGLHWKRDGMDRYLNYTTDPAAWGALFVWLADQDRLPSLKNAAKIVSVFAPHPLWIAEVKNSSDWRNQRQSELPGRALVLATLAAYGVEVEG